jgi:hypothetical protein
LFEEEQLRNTQDIVVSKEQWHMNRQNVTGAFTHRSIYLSLCNSDTRNDCHRCISHLFCKSPCPGATEEQWQEHFLSVMIWLLSRTFKNGN